MADNGSIHRLFKNPAHDLQAGKFASLPFDHAPSENWALPLDAGSIRLTGLRRLPDDCFNAVDEALENIGRSRRVAASIAAMHPRPEIVAVVNHVAALPEGIVENSPMRDWLTVFTLPVAIEPAPTDLLWHRRSHDHIAQCWLRDVIVALAPATLLERANRPRFRPRTSA